MDHFSVECRPLSYTIVGCMVSSAAIIFWRLFRCFCAVFGWVMVSVFNATRRVFAVDGRVTNALAGVTLGRSGSFVSLDFNLEVEYRLYLEDFFI